MARKKKKSKKRRNNRKNNLRNKVRTEANSYDPLEPRQLLATIAVNSAADNTIADGLTTLREAINTANLTAEADTIDMSAISGQTITLALRELVVTNPLTIEGSNVTIDAAEQSRAINFVGPNFSASFATDSTKAFGLDLTLNDLTIENGRTFGSNANRAEPEFSLLNDGFFSGGGVRFNSSGTLTLNNSTVKNSGTAGTLAHGGGIFAIGDVILENGSEVSGNVIGNEFAINPIVAAVLFGPIPTLAAHFGGLEFDPGNSAMGGGVYSQTTVEVDDSTVSGNQTLGRAGSGGGIAAMDRVLLRNDALVKNNVTVQNDSPGGGIHAGGFIAKPNGSLELRTGRVYVNDSKVEGNRTLDRGSSGGGISADHVFLRNGSSVSDNATIANGSTGGGVFANGLLEITDSTLSSNATGGGTSGRAEIGCKVAVEIAKEIIGLFIPATKVVDAVNDIYSKFGYINDIVEAATGEPLVDLDPCPESAGSSGYGGGAHARGISVLRSDIESNSTTGYGAVGGGLFAAGNVSITQSLVANNFTNGEKASGGAIFANNKVVIVNSRVAGNSTNGDIAGGGAIAANVVEVQTSELNSNKTTAQSINAIVDLSFGSSAGGAIRSFDRQIEVPDDNDPDEDPQVENFPGKVIITNSGFAGNSTERGKSPGGAVFSSGDVEITNSSFLLNHTSGDRDSGPQGGFSPVGGGAVAGVNVTINGSTFDQNYTTGEGSSGGAVLAKRQLNIDNSTFTGNHVNGEASGPWRSNGGAVSGNHLVVSNSTITGNRAKTKGGGIHAGFTLKLKNSIVLGNLAQNYDGDSSPPGHEIHVHRGDYGVLTSLNNNVVGTTADDNNVAVVEFNGTNFTPDSVSDVFANTQTISGTGFSSFPAGALGYNGGPQVGFSGTVGTSLNRSAYGIKTAKLVAGPFNAALDINNFPSPFSDRGDQVDQRGFSRGFSVLGSPTTVDAGAFEVTRSLLVTTDSRYGQPGETTLEDAIQAANLIDGRDTIRFVPDLAGATIELTADLRSILEGVTFDASNLSSPVTISGLDQRRIFDFVPEAGKNSNLTLNNLILTNGQQTGNNSSGTTFHNFSGGAIRAMSGTVTLIDSTVRDSRTRGDFAEGGGIFSTGNVLLFNSSIEDNQTGTPVSNSSGVGSKGGGISAQSVSLHDGSSVSGNRTGGTDADGGGIYASSGVIVFADGGVIEANGTTGDYAAGGGVFAGSYVALYEGARVERNATLDEDARGGGIYTNGLVKGYGAAIVKNVTRGINSDGAGVFATNVTLTDSDVAGNGTRGLGAQGGGLSVDGTATINNTSIRDNYVAGGTTYSSGGGGLHALTANISNSTIAGNFTSGPTASGGGIRAANLTLTGSTVTGNSTSGAPGGGVFATNSQITNSIVLENFANSSTNNEIVSSTAVDFQGNNIVGETASDFDATVSPNVRNVAATPGGTIFDVFHETVNVRVDADGDGTAELEIPGRSAGVAKINGGVSRTVALHAGASNPAVDGTVEPSALFSFEGNAVNGFGVDAAFVGGLTATAEGIRGDAVEFTGNSTQYVQLADPLTIGDKSHTVEIWVKVPLAGTAGLGSSERVGEMLGSFSSSPNANWGILADGQVQIFWNNGQVRLRGLQDLRDNQWHQLTFVRDTVANEFRAYIDGNVEPLTGAGGNTNSAGSNITFTTPHRIGLDNRSSGPVPFHGSMDELTIHDRALTADEIKILAGRFDQRGDGFQRVISPEQIGGGSGPSRQDLGAFELEAVVEARSLIVTTAVDEVNPFDGETSLREAIEFANDPTAGANNNGDADNNGSISDTVSFAANLSGATIELVQGELEITQSLTITAPVDGITIDADRNSRVLHFSETTGNLTINNLNLINGRTTETSEHGAGLLFESTGFLQLFYSSVEGNATLGDSASGGGIFSNASTNNIDFSSIHRNSTQGDGSHSGGLYLNGAATLTSTTVSNNSTRGLSSVGGGITSFSNPLTLSNVTISGNSTHAGSGGGIFASDLTLNNSTVTNNTVGEAGRYGGGLYATGDLTVNNSIVLGNLTIDQVGNDIGGAATTTTFGGQNIVGQSDSDFDISSFSNVIHASPSDVFANLTRPRMDTNGDGVVDATFPGKQSGLLLDNGGVVSTIALRPHISNPAIDSGVDSLAATIDDARGNGFERIEDLAGPTNNGTNSIDIGAFEVQDDVIEVGSLVVNTDLDVVDSGDLLISLREAIAYANDSSAGILGIGDADNNGLALDTITFATGPGEVFENGGTIVLTNGELLVTDALAIDASFADNEVTIDGDNLSRIINFTDNAGSVVPLDRLNLELTNLHLTNGNVSSDEINEVDTRFSGGAVRFNSTGTLTIRNSLIDNNSVGLAAGGGVFSAGYATIENSTITNNTVSGIGDGSISEGLGGGGIASEALRIVGSTVNKNESNANRGRGGGVYARSQAYIVNSTISDNVLGGNESLGGGLATRGGVVLDHATIVGNSTTGGFSHGGGVYSEGDAFVYNSTFSGNFTDGSGSVGGGLAAETTKLTNSIFLGNVAKQASNNEIAGAQQGQSNEAFFYGMNLIGTDSAQFDSSVSASVENANIFRVFKETQSITGTSFFEGKLRFNGGTVRTIALKADVLNPALDAGQDDLVSGLTIGDSRGRDRFFDLLAFRNERVNVSDLGPFELSDFDESVIIGGDLVVTTADGDGNPFDGENSLREAIAFAATFDEVGIPRVTFAADIGDAFSSDATIALTSGEIAIDSDIVIDGTGPGNLTIDAGGASRIFSLASPDQSTFTIQNLSLTNGFDAGTGGAINLVDSNDKLILDNVVITNSSANGGGAVHVGGNASFEIINSSLVNNSSNFAGSAILASGNNDGLIANSTISGNSSGSGVGAINQQTGGMSNLQLRNVTVADNVGHGLFNYAFGGGDANVEIGNSIFANNSVGNVASAGPGTATLTSSGNNISDDGSTGFTGVNDQTNLDPLLNPIDFSQPTLFHTLQNSSPAIDSGNSALLDHLVRPTSVVANVPNFSGRDVSNLISNSGITEANFRFTPETATGDSWVTLTAGGSDYFEAGGTQPSLEFTLDSVESMNSVAIWGYRQAASNDIKNFILEFSTDGGLTFNESVVLSKPAFTSTNFLNILSFDRVVQANHVRMTITDNYGGNRVGFQEIRFLSQLENDQRGEGKQRIVDGDFDALEVVDVGAVEQRNVLFVDAFGDVDDGIETPGNLTIREAIRLADTVPGHDTIMFDTNVFSEGDSIMLTSELTPDESLTIAGPGASYLSIDANSNSRIFNLGDAGANTYTITGLTLVNGFASGTNAGGAIILSDADDTLIVDGVEFLLNTANGGGAIFTSGSDYFVSNSSFVDNHANFNGSAILAFGDANGVIYNTTISSNTSNGTGGALFVQSTGVDTVTVLRNVTVTDNDGHGVQAFSSDGSIAMVDIGNSIVAGNGVATGATNGAVGGASIFLSSGFNISDDNSLAFSAASDLINTDPLLGVLDYYGGETLTHSLQPGSPAIDAGNNSLATDGSNRFFSFDQRGSERIHDGNDDSTATVDIGAFEAVFAPTVQSIVVNGGDTQRSLVKEITVSFSEIVNVDASSFIVKNTDSTVCFLPNVVTEVVNGQTVATLTFSGSGITNGSLPDGNYELEILDAITDTSGNQLDGDGDGIAGDNATDEFFRLYGDMTGDGLVNIFDLLQFRQTYGRSAGDGSFNASADFNGDGIINVFDLLQFRNRYGTSV